MNREIKFRFWDGEKIHITDFHITCFGIAWKSDDRENGMEGTLSQYTGLKDKNGVDIYEGDIIKSALTDENFPVVYEVNYAQFTYGGCEFNVESLSSNIEVIGNIYQNLELINPIPK